MNIDEFKKLSPFEQAQILALERIAKALENIQREVNE